MPRLTNANYHGMQPGSFVNAPPALYVLRELSPLEPRSSEVTPSRRSAETDELTTTVTDKATKIAPIQLLENLYDSKNPFPKLFRRIESLQQLSDNWNSYGSAAPNQRAQFWARRALHELMRLNFPPTTVNASSDEGVAIFFHSADKRASIECMNNGEILAVLSKGQEAPEVWAI